MVKYNARTGSAAGAVFVAVVAALILIAFGAWIFMLLLGMFAGYMAMPGLALGYWASMGVLAMIRLVFVKAEAS